MKKILLFLLLFLFPIFLGSFCWKPPVIIPPTYSYEPNGIGLYIKADPKLHFYQGYPHTIRLCLYQLIDPMEFNQLKDKKEGLEKLCEGSSFGGKVTTLKCYFLNPGHELRETLDRAEGTKWVGLIACYYHLQESKVVYLDEIPIVEKIEKKTIQKKPGKLNINLYLGPEEIQRLR